MIQKNKITVVPSVAGSGKTTLLVDVAKQARTKWGISSNEILAVTYSKKLATELQSKTQGNARARSLHSLGRSLVIKNLQDLGFKRKPNLWKTRKDQNFFVRLAESEGLEEIPARNLYNKHFMHGLELEAAASGLLELPEAKRIKEIFTKEKLRRNVFSFHDMIQHANTLFELSTKEDLFLDLPKVLLVDEYQDFNKFEKQLVWSLIDHAETSVIVGDDRQMIYGFKGAEIGAMEELKRLYPDCQVITRNVSYRITQQMANLEKACSHRQDAPPEIKTVKEGEKPVLYLGLSRERTYRAVALEIQELRDQGISDDQIMVLSRFRKHTKQLSLFLTDLGIPVSTVSLRNQERNTLKKFYYFGNAILDKKNKKLAFYLKKYLSLSKEQAEGVSKNPEATIQRQDLNFEKTLADKTRERLNCFLECRKVLEAETTKEHYRLKKILRKFISNFQGKVDAFRNYSILHILDRYDLYPEELNLENLLENISWFLLKHEKEGVHLGTIHQNKGGEREYVFMTDIHDEIIFKNSYRTNEEEESNIFHVGITRASERLYLVFSLEQIYQGIRKKEKGKGEIKRNSLIRFLPKEYFLKGLCELREVW